MNVESTLSQWLRRLGLSLDADSVSDGHLLDLYLQRSDPAAFEALMRRHGPMVMGVCQRMLPSREDAEDAFQATFMVLVRKASDIQPRNQIGNWLHGVAFRVALQARSDLMRRRRREENLRKHTEPNPPARDDLFELRSILDREIHRLPKRYRQPIVLCLLEERSRKDAACILGCTEGTLSGWLARARQLLKKRLARLVSLVPPTALAGLLVENAKAAVPLESITVNLASGFADSYRHLSSRVIFWQERTLTTMWMEQTKRIFYGITLGTLLCVLGFAVIRQVAVADPAAQETPLVEKQPQNKKADQRIKPVNRLFFVRNSEMVSVQTDGKNLQSHSKNTRFPYSPMWSPDGKQVAYGRRKTYVPPPKGQSTPQDLLCNVYIKSAMEKGEGKKLTIKADYFRWTRDGKSLLLSAFDSGDLTSSLVDVKTGKVTPLDLPNGHVATDVTRDGQWFLTTYISPRIKGQLPLPSLWLVKRDKSIVKKLSTKSKWCYLGKFSPDDTRILCLAMEKIPKKVGRKGLIPSVYVMDKSNGNLRRVAQELNGDIQGFCWSPDGKQVAYVWRTLHEDGKSVQPTESFLMLVNADGSNPRTILSATGQQQYIITLSDVCWR